MCNFEPLTKTHIWNASMPDSLLSTSTSDEVPQQVNVRMPFPRQTLCHGGHLLATTPQGISHVELHSMKHEKFLRCSFFSKRFEQPTPSLLGSGQKSKRELQATLSYLLPAPSHTSRAFFSLGAGYTPACTWKFHPSWCPKLCLGCPWA